MSYNKTNKFFLFFLFVLVLLSLLVHSSSAIFSFENYDMISLTSLPKELHESPSIAVDGNNIHVVWATWPDEYNCAVYYKKSNDNGKNWSNTVNINLNESKAVSPCIAVNDNYVNVIWIDYRNNQSEIYHSYSNDNGQTWNGPNRLTFNSTRKSCIFDISIYSNGNNFYAVWKDYRYGSSEILFKKSSDNGLTWDDDQRLTADYTPSYMPFLSYSKSNLYIVYEDWDSVSKIAFLKSNDGGNSWSNKVQLTGIQNNGDSENPYLFAKGDILYLLWQNKESSNYNIFFSKSNDDGKTWDDAKQITYSSNASFNPKMHVYNQNVIIIWQEFQNNSKSIFYKTSEDDGKTWGDIQTIISDKDCYDIDFSAYEENIHFVWQVYHEPTWGDIWYYANSNYVPVNDPIDNSNKNDGSPGFEFIILLFSISILIFILKNNKKKGRF